MNILILTKRQYTNKDLIDEKFGRVWEVPEYLAKQGHDVLGFCLSYQRKEEKTYLPGEKNNSSLVKWQTLNAGNIKFLGLVRFHNKILKAANGFKPDLIISFSDPLYTILGHKISSKLNIHHIADLYDNFEYFKSYSLPFVKGRFKLSLLKAKGISVVSEELAQHLREEYQINQKVHVLTNGIDPQFFCPLDKKACREKLGLPLDKKIIGLTGSIFEERGVSDLFDAYKELTNKRNDIHLLLAGKIKEGEKLPEHPSITYLGNVEYKEITTVINALDVGVITNRCNTFGLFCFPQKLYEYLSCGIPIVAAKVGVMERLLAHHPECSYTPNDVNSLVKALERQLDGPVFPEIVPKSWEELVLDFHHYIIDQLSSHVEN